VKRVQIIAVLLASTILGGCSIVLEKDAVSQLQKQCAAKGMQFIQTDSKKTELLVVAQAQVSGVCVGPGDPRYVAPTK
jgi:hypothetical protein